jgi:hypothetical protein
MMAKRMQRSSLRVRTGCRTGRVDSHSWHVTAPFWVSQFLNSARG